MVQVDVFWSYGIGAGFALAAAHQLTRAAPPLSATGPAATGPAPTGPAATGPDGLGDRYLTVTLLYLGALFVPSGAWLLWQFPSWETMHASTGTLPAWLVAAFVATNATQGVLGYVVTRRLVRRGRARLAYLQFVLAYFAMFFILVHGWDGTGYRRFFSPTRADYDGWATGTAAGAVRSWLTSDVALTLYGMGVVLIPVLLGITARWHAAGVRFALMSLASIFGLALGGAVVASVLVHTLGWAAGVAAFCALAAGALLPRRSPARWLTAQMMAPGQAAG
jgi:hypothetical protein